MSLTKYWIQAHDLERLAQLRQDAKNVYDTLITLAYAAKDDAYAKSLEAQYRAIDAYIERALDAAVQPDSAPVSTINVQGDYINADIKDSDNVAVGKGIKQKAKKS